MVMDNGEPIAGPGVWPPPGEAMINHDFSVVVHLDGESRHRRKFPNELCIPTGASRPYTGWRCGRSVFQWPTAILFAWWSGPPVAAGGMPRPIAKTGQASHC